MGKTDHDTFCTLCPYVPIYSQKIIADGLMEDGICTPLRRREMVSKYRVEHFGK